NYLFLRPRPSSVVLVLESIRGRRTKDEDEDDKTQPESGPGSFRSALGSAVASNLATSFESIETMRSRMSFPDWIRSRGHACFATSASRHAAHSVAEPRASSKNLARAGR